MQLPHITTTDSTTPQMLRYSYQTEDQNKNLSLLLCISQVLFPNHFGWLCLFLLDNAFGFQMEFPVDRQIIFFTHLHHSSTPNSSRTDTATSSVLHQLLLRLFTTIYNYVKCYSSLCCNILDSGGFSSTST